MIDINQMKYHENTSCDEIAEDLRKKYGGAVYDIRHKNKFKEIIILGESWCYHQVFIKNGIVYDYISGAQIEFNRYKNAIAISTDTSEYIVREVKKERGNCINWHVTEAEANNTKNKFENWSI